MRTAFLLAALAAVFSHAAMARCTSSEHHFAGTVAAADGMAVPGAGIIVSWYEKGMETGPIHVAVSNQGAFDAAVKFATYTATTLTGDDICKERLKFVRICASADGYTPQCKRVAAADGEPTRFVLSPEREAIPGNVH